MRGRLGVFATIAAFAALFFTTTPAAAVTGVRSAFPGDAPDPFVLTAGGRHHLFATNINPFGTAYNVPVWVSEDLRSWQFVADALPDVGAWASAGFTWAPAVGATPAGYVLYYTALHRASGRQCIGAATSVVPQGPFTPAADPLVCPAASGGAIDPDPFVAADGRRYLHWKVDGNAVGGAVTIQGRELAAGGTAFAAGSTTRTLLSAGGGPTWERGIIENPAMALAGGTHWLLFSGGSWDTAGYGVGAARCQGPLGPCTRASTAPWLSGASGPAGPGGASVFLDRAGRLRVAFHGWPGAVGYGAGGSRWPYVEPLDLTANGPVLRTDLPAAAAHPGAWRPFATPEAFVQRQYVDLLGRSPDAGGSAGWSAVLRDGRDDGVGIADGFFGSHEYSGLVEPVTRFYFSAFGRLPDVPGLRAWLQARRNGVTLEGVAQGFAGSDEFAARYGGGTDEEYVTALYVNALGRRPDPGGLAGWTQVLAGGATRAQVLLAFSESPEHRDRVRSPVRVVGAYAGLLDRRPDTRGYLGWVDFLDAGNSVRDFLAGVLWSPEYARRVGG